MNEISKKIRNDDINFDYFLKTLFRKRKLKINQKLNKLLFSGQIHLI